MVLSLVATPIGNLDDLSPRALAVLQECNCILAEDTRRTKILAMHYGIKTPLVSFPSYQEKRKLRAVLERLEAGEHLALVSDAGIPGICDPGTCLVSECHAKGVIVDVIPGPSAVVTVAALSGLCEQGFLFVGYFPQKKGEIELFFKRVSQSNCPIIFFEAPHRLHTTLQNCARYCPNATLFLARELTKKFQEYDLGSAIEISSRWSTRDIKGEFVLCLQPKEEKIVEVDMEDLLSDLEMLKAEGCSLKTATQILAKHVHIPHKQLYKYYLAHTHK